jgi:hypothetical protein
MIPPATTIPPSESASNISFHEKPEVDIEKAFEEIQPKPTTVDEEIAAFGPAPDGGLKAWLNATGAFCIFFCCLGFTSCFGVLQEYYSTHQVSLDYPQPLQT